jgi:hypothetical protein
MSGTHNRTERSPFGSYRTYVSRLQSLMRETRRKPDWEEQVVAALNGEASTELRRAIGLKTRRKYGAYFTGTILGERLLKKCSSFDANRIFYDASCGMGDLLLAAAKNLPLAKSLPQTLAQWGRQLTGTDLHSEFVAGAKTRLVLLARHRHQTTEALSVSLDRFFPHIRVADGLAERTAFQKATTLLLNPPFGLVKAPKNCDWAGGRMSQAAMFLITALERSRPCTEILAILPDVLRSGSFSQRWRNRVSELAEVHLIDPYGIFDESADVDVFLLRLVRRVAVKSVIKRKWPTPRTARSATVGDYFKVHVGRVVPYRDIKTGPRYPYIHPRCVQTWTIVTDFTEHRKHKGPAYTPPFVVIRRTSRPGDAYRAAATVINGKCPIAVENHLIVCEPKDGKLATCKKLMLRLKTDAVNEYLNTRIRCRHLTVEAIKKAPVNKCEDPKAEFS